MTGPTALHTLHGPLEHLPDVMTAAVTTGHGGPEVVEIRDDWPRPRPGPGQILVRVMAAGVNNTDLWTREGAHTRSAFVRVVEMARQGGSLPLWRRLTR